MRRSLRLIVCLLISANPSPIVAAQGPATAPATVAADDLLEITISGASEPGQETIFRERVDPNGQINLPLLGPVGAKGLTPADLAGRIDAAFNTKKLIKQARARVRVAESGASVSIRSGPVARGDRVRISVWDLSAPGMQDVFTQVVDTDGMVDLPLIGKHAVADQTEADVERTVAKAYKDKELLANAMVECLRLGAPAPGRRGNSA